MGGEEFHHIAILNEGYPDQVNIPPSKMNKFKSVLKNRNYCMYVVSFCI